jgi:transposase
MAMGTRKRRERQEELWYKAELPTPPGHPFYKRLNEVLDKAEFDRYCEANCAEFYHEKLGRPSLAPGLYFRVMMIGFFEGLDSERGIAWRLADSLTLRQFLSTGLDEKTPDHVTISRTRRLINAETHQRIFNWVLERLAQGGLIKGKTIGVDSTTLEANAAMKSIVRRDTGESYGAYLKGLAEAEGGDAKGAAALLRMDRKRQKKTSNEDWQSPSDGEAEITKLKDGRTALAYKAENAVDMKTGAIIAVTTHGGAAADTATVEETVIEAGIAVGELTAEKTAEGKYEVHAGGVEEVVADKGYHSNDVAVVSRKWVCVVMWLNRIAVRATGMAKRRPRPPFMRTGGAFKASAASVCSGNAENGSSATSRISLIPAVSTGFMCEASRMSTRSSSYRRLRAILRY